MQFVNLGVEIFVCRFQLDVALGAIVSHVDP
jgi:hypothetical protein